MFFLIPMKMRTSRMYIYEFNLVIQSKLPEIKSHYLLIKLLRNRKFLENIRKNKDERKTSQILFVEGKKWSEKLCWRLSEHLFPGAYT